MTAVLPSVLITGFEPFDGDTVNPSQEIARALDGKTIAGHHVVGVTLPVEFARALPALDDLIGRHRPVLVLALGLAAGRAAISLERVAINLIDARIADNAGAQPIDVAVVENAANAYFSTLPLKAMLAALRNAGIDATLSHSAGTFVCNQVFFGLAHRIAQGAAFAGGFIHVPCLPEQTARHGDVSGVPLERMIEAVRICVETALKAPADPHFAAGSIE